MRRRQKQQRGTAQIELTPLIDMVFIILIFFIVSTSFIRESGVEVTRPESSLSRSIAGTFVAIAIDDGGHVFIANRLISVDDVHGIARELQNQKSSHVVIQADKMVPLSIYTAVQDSCFKAGAERVDLATELSP